MTRVYLAAYRDGMSTRYQEVGPEDMGAEPWVPEGAVVRVKALEFVRDEIDLITEDARYIIAQTFGEWRVWFHSDPLRDARGRPISYDGEPQAVSAANTHHEARILAALEVVPLAADPAVKALVAEAEARGMERAAARARVYASNYEQSSDGRNTFILLAEWADIEAAAIRKGETP